LSDPLQSLQAGHWFKLICGASFQHIPAIRSLAVAYTLAGVDCIDVAADPAVVAAARSGIKAAQQIAPSQGQMKLPQPILMVSLNDGEDLHFRKATFDPQHCLPTCPQPCVTVCPAEAITFSPLRVGVVAERCYGCGRCLPVCPIAHIKTQAQPADLAVILPLVEQKLVQALELHTQVGHQTEFGQLWAQVQPLLPHLKLLAVSCPEDGDVLAYLTQLYEWMQPLPCPLIWQTDGRPMSGDIGDGTTHATIRYGKRVLYSTLPGYVQLAGGTNRQTVPKLLERGLLKGIASTIVPEQPWIAGVAYGSYARRLFNAVQDQLEAKPQSSYRLEDYPELLAAGVELASQLVMPLKQASLVAPTVSAIPFEENEYHGKQSLNSRV
jgi:Fe-S-cluster-containing hydrogenase component 2